MPPCPHCTLEYSAQGLPGHYKHCQETVPQLRPPNFTSANYIGNAVIALFTFLTAYMVLNQGSKEWFGRGISQILQPCVQTMNEAEALKIYNFVLAAARLAILERDATD